MGGTDGYTAIVNVRQIDFSDEAAIMYEIEQFAETYAYADVEHALVITPAGKVYILKGNEVTVNPAIIGHGELVGSVVIHNHPVDLGFSMGDSFSQEDLVFAAHYKLKRQYLVSGTRRNSLEFKAPYAIEEICNAWERAEYIMQENARANKADIIHWQADTLSVLVGFIKGVVFNDRF